MNAEIDYDLTLDQWEALKALRTPPAKRRGLNRASARRGDWRWTGHHA
jgi:hypothetical protein